MGVYRPWGNLLWILDRCAKRQWAFFGCLGTEQRSIAAWREMHATGCLSVARLLRIKDAPLSPHAARAATLESDREREFVASGGNAADIQQHNLMESHFEIVNSLDTFLNQSGPNMVLDVSSMPKRFFFPALRRLLKEPAKVQNLIVAYTVPNAYTQEKLAENPDDWDHLPLFTGAYGPERPEIFVINVGFEGFGLQDRVEHGDSGLPIKLILPFPSPPTSLKRSWELVRKLKRNRPDSVFKLYRADSREIGDAFDRLLSLTNHGQRRAILAPFGPKPISVAFCIYATLTDSEVFYTQPTAYHPDYSSGIAVENGLSAIYGYCLRLNGRDLYTLT
jgi:hypothetical protein